MAVDDVLDVLCFVFPDGTAHFMSTEDGLSGEPTDVIKAWESIVPTDESDRLKAAPGVRGGVTGVRMLRSSYDGLVRSPRSIEISRALQSAKH